MVRLEALTRRLFRSSCTGRQYSKFHSHTWRCSCPTGPRQGFSSPLAAGPQGRAAGPGGLMPQTAGPELTGMWCPFKVKSAWPSTPSSSHPHFFGGRRGLVLPGGWGAPLHSLTNTQLRILTERRTETDLPHPTPRFQGSGILGISAPGLNWGEALFFPEELSPGLPTSLPAPSP